MAEVIGFLREDATDGKKETLKLLSRNLPGEFVNYVASPIHRFKGLEAEVVFILHLQNTFRREEEEYLAAERRILYIAMSRARMKTCASRTWRISWDEEIVCDELLVV